MMLFGLGAGAVFAPLSLTILSAVRPQESGAAAGLLQTVQQVGGSVGTAVLVTVFDASVRRMSGRPGPSAVLAHGMAEAMWASCAFVLAAFALIVLVVGPPGRPVR
jgi:hypothetical protein